MDRKNQIITELRQLVADLQKQLQRPDERIADLEAKLEELRNDLEALCLAFQYELRELKEKRLTSSKTVLAHAQRSTAEEADAAGEEAGS